MSYGRFGSLQRSRVTFGCLVAVGSIATAGIAEIEIQGKVFSGGISSISESIQLRDQSPHRPEPEKLVTSEHVFFPFTYIGSEAKKLYPHVKSFFEGASGVISFFKESGKEVIGGVGSFLSTLIEPKTFNKIFDNIHKKVGNFISFFVIGGSDRDSFMELFWGDKGQSTSLAVKFLLGKEIDGNKFFKAKPDVFSFFLLSGADDPKKVTGKFERLFKKVEELIKETQKIGTSLMTRGGNGGGQQPIPMEKRVYGLEIPTVSAYLNTRKGGYENIFTSLGKKRVITKIKTGTEDTEKAENGVKNGKS